jgi:tetraacyldisaccharide 4'-kinase
VISIGNLSVGGTGKTPIASWVVRTLGALGERPVLVARGYGRDELLLHRRWNPDVPVIADPDRHAGVTRGAAEGATVAVLDDGFQHRALARDVDLVLVAAEEGLPGALLPRGPFREPLSALRRAAGVIVTRKQASEEDAVRVAERVGREATDAVVARVQLRTGTASPIHGAERSDPTGPVLVASGVAHPESVRAGALALGYDVEALIPFPDHHEFDRNDVRSLEVRAAGRPVLVTEKDAVKLESVEGADGVDFRVLSLELRWEAGREGIARLLETACGGDA